MSFARFGEEFWWAKSPLASTEHPYSVLYHHVNDATKRQVIVTCGSVIQECVIPVGFDPQGPTTAAFELSTPSIIYEHGGHALGIIVIPKTETKTMRNRIWKIKDLARIKGQTLFDDALTHGRAGHFRTTDKSIA
ncbi:MAG TPA: hypothetical protein PKE12_05595 [Kiritimatiellia bacterium]|nr:hypothetical protein [Kiritimatiellia bacterium]